MAQNTNLNTWGLILTIALLVFLPLVLGPYQLRLVTEAVIFALFAVSYNLLLGYAGMLSFGHAMFFGMGAFTTAVAVNSLPGLPFLGAVALSILSATLLGLVIGLLLLRVKGTPFALLTLAFGALIYAIGVKWHSVTGGDDGLSLTPPNIDLGLVTINTLDGLSFYYLTLLVVGAAVAYCWYFTRTAMGQSVLLIRDNEERMRFLGYNTHAARLILFVFTGAMAGLAGSFYAFFNSFVSLDTTSMDMTSRVLLMTFIGGTGSFLGPVMGSFFYTYVQDYLSNLTENWPLIMGVLFIAMVLWTPGGLSGLLRRAAEALPGRSAKRGGE